MLEGSLEGQIDADTDKFLGVIKRLVPSSGYGLVECAEISTQFGCDAFLPHACAEGFYGRAQMCHAMPQISVSAGPCRAGASL